MSKSSVKAPLTEESIREQLLNDYRLACLSREASLLGRKEVLTGKAKFGIFGDGKELAQIALAKQFKKGDFRSGYYRDQTIMMALDLLSVKEYFAALYGHVDLGFEPASGGRQMGGHYATRSLHEDGSWKNLMEQYNSSADISPTAGQMPRLLGLAQASKVYRALDKIDHLNGFSNNGDEVAFGTIGDASTSEGLFWESMNAASVLQVPMVMSVWDDGYGISVAKEYQTTKGSISEALAGFQKTTSSNGFQIFTVKGWNYPELLLTYDKAVRLSREEHVPVLVHVEDMTQPQGHSTSGSHERYKSPERLKWAEEFDCITKFKEFLMLEGAVSEAELDNIRKAAKKEVRAAQKEAWADFRAGIDKEKQQALAWFDELIGDFPNLGIEELKKDIESNQEVIRKEIASAVRLALRLTRGEESAARSGMVSWYQLNSKENNNRYSSHLYSESNERTGNIKAVAPEYPAEKEMVDGRLVLRGNFEVLFNKYPELITFGEDTGKIGGVNQSMEGMQDIFGETRVADTGIREATILGQGIGMSMRGLRPIAEIQYLDYLYYALQIMRDDLASVQYRTKGGQKAPLIIRTRGHRLEGIWHSGSPMGAIINSIRGINVCVPRNMVQAAGMYNLLLEADEPALVVECLNGYRTKEALPSNLGEFKVALGCPEVVKEGSDITVVSYGSTFNLCEKAVAQLNQLDIDVELIDIQTLLPFDLEHSISKSLKKTNKVIFIDEDVAGGASAFMLDQVLNVQNAWKHLDAQPKTLCAKPHLPAYGTDGDYFSKPSIDDIVEAIYAVMHENHPSAYPSIY